MKHFKGIDWLYIDAANAFGMDKLLFEERIQWAKDNLDILETLSDKADNIPMYRKAVMAIRKAHKGIPTGHLVGVDACCSGIQIMSVLMGDEVGAESTGLINPNVRADAYGKCTDNMGKILGSKMNVSRQSAKEALMTVMYGSRAKPKEIFGEDTPELNAFYQAAMQTAPGAWELLQVLLASWRPFALEHTWKMPDGFDCKVKVMSKIEHRIEVDELDHATFTYQYYDNEGTKSGKSNAANVIHSVDAYVLRSMHRRCNYDKDLVEGVQSLIEIELLARICGEPRTIFIPEGNAGYFVEQYMRSGVVDITILPYLYEETLQSMSTEHIQGLASIINGMLQYKPFELVTIHDEFRAHANNVNWVRWQYKEILAELAESSLIDDLLTQVYKHPITIQQYSNTLGQKIRNSEYALT